MAEPTQTAAVALPPPGLTDCCLWCGRDEPLYLLEGAEAAHTHICVDCLRRGVSSTSVTVRITGAATAEDVRAALAKRPSAGMR